VTVRNHIEEILAESERRGDWMASYRSTDVYLRSLAMPCFIYGASNGGRHILTRLNDLGIPVAGFVDSSSNKWGMQFCGLLVSDPSSLKCEDVVVIGSMYEVEIAQYLNSRGVLNIIPYDDFIASIIMIDRDYVVKCASQYESLEALLSDAASTECLRWLIEYGLTRRLNNTYVSSYHQYAHPLVQACPGDIVVDGGAYTGDSAASVFALTSGNCTIHAFEPFNESYASLVAMANDPRFYNRLIPHRAALGHTDGTGFLHVDSLHPQQSVITTQPGGIEIQVTTIDKHFGDGPIYPDLIKLDVEGFEVDALLGAQKTIISCAPKLQIAIYHMPDHLWSIPLMLHEWVPSYQFYIGHHHCAYVDTVLYAVSQ